MVLMEAQSTKIAAKFSLSKERAEGEVFMDTIAKLTLQTTENTAAIAKLDKTINEKVLRKSDLPKIFKNCARADAGKKTTAIMEAQDRIIYKQLVDGLLLNPALVII